MTTSHDEPAAEGGSPKGISRRTVVKGAAWSVPVIAAVTAVPAFATSPNCLEAAFSGDSCKGPGAGNDWSYKLSVCFTNTCVNCDLEVTITQMTNNAGKQFYDDRDHTTFTQIVIDVPADGQPHCTPLQWFYSSSSAAKIWIYYTLKDCNGNTTTPPYIELFAPPNDCPVATSS